MSDDFLELIKLPGGCLIEVARGPCDTEAEDHRIQEQVDALWAEFVPKFQPSALTKIADADALVMRLPGARHAR